jgi:hypothetical protein
MRLSQFIIPTYLPTYLPTTTPHAHTAYDMSSKSTGTRRMTRGDEATGGVVPPMTIAPQVLQEVLIQAIPIEPQQNLLSIGMLSCLLKNDKGHSWSTTVMPAARSESTLPNRPVPHPF